MSKRMTIRFVDSIHKQLESIAKEKGLSINAVVTEMAWDFVTKWQQKRDKN